MEARERKIDVSKMSAEQVELLEAQIGGKMREICDKACAEANRILNIYGMSAKMQFLLHKQEVTKEQLKTELAQEEPKKKRGRPRKVSQSLS